MKRAVIALLMATFFAAPCVAQDDWPLRFHGGLGIATTSYSEAAADRSNTVSRSFGVQSFVEPRFYDTVGLPVGLGWEYLGPICLEVDSSVDCGRGEEETSLLFGSIGIALHGPPLPTGFDAADSDWRPFIVTGREWVSRGIGDSGCLNCVIDTVRFDGGLFIEPGAEFSAGPHLTVSLGYRLYRNGSDLESRFGVRLATRRL